MSKRERRIMPVVRPETKKEKINTKPYRAYFNKYHTLERLDVREPFSVAPRAPDVAAGRRFSLTSAAFSRCC